MNVRNEFSRWILEKQIDINAVDLNKLKVKDLKKILTDWGEPADYYEKSEFIKRINDVKDKYVKSTADTKTKDLWLIAIFFVSRSNNLNDDKQQSNLKKKKIS